MFNGAVECSGLKDDCYALVPCSMEKTEQFYVIRVTSGSKLNLSDSLMVIGDNLDSVSGTLFSLAVFLASRDALIPTVVENLLNLLANIFGIYCV